MDFIRQNFDVVISLGCCCEINFLLDKIGLTNERYPFDWLAVYKFDDVISSIEGKFSRFLCSVEEKPNIYLQKEDEQLKIDGLDIYIPHYSKDIYDQKIISRVNRFNQKIATSDKILFIRKSHYDVEQVNIDQINNFNNLIKRLNPDLDYFLLVVNEIIDKKFSVKLVNHQERYMIINIYGNSKHGKGYGIIRCDCKNTVLDHWIPILQIMENNFTHRS